MTEQELIDRLTSNVRAFHFISDEEKDFMRNWPYGVLTTNRLGEFVGVDKPAFLLDRVYRLNPAPSTPLNLPWEWIADHYQWAVMDEDHRVYVLVNKPRVVGKCWSKSGSNFYLNMILKIDTTGIDWRTSLTKRPEASE
jgi:hypothetical protein